jgi:hypothetical protein
VTERLYGISVRERPGVSVWHASVRYYDLIDSAGRIVAGFYLDPYSRVEKRSGAWMDECVVAKSLPSGKAVPVAQLVCNFTAPVGNGSPSLLTHDEVTTLFHEFGHGLHHMLTQVAYPSIAGINGVAWDAVELPSQFMENFVWRPEVLPLISAHVKTGEPLPADDAAAPVGHPHLQCGARHPAANRARELRFRIARELRPGSRARVVAETSAACGSGWRWCRRRRSIACPRASRTSSPAATPRATTATNGRRCWRPTRSRRSRRPGVRQRDRGAVSSIPFWPAAAAWTRWTPSCAFAAAAGRAPAAQTNRHRRVKWRGVQGLAAAVMLLTAASGRAATAYVTDELVLNVYADQNQPGSAPRDPAFRRERRDARRQRDYTQVGLAMVSPGGSKHAS